MRNESLFSIFAFLMLSFSSHILMSQVAVSNLYEYQLGNEPNEEPSNLTRSFEQMQLDYYHEEILIGLRYESFKSENSHHRFSMFRQRYVEWQHSNMRLRIGNFYGMLGRGLVFRAFELPAVIQEAQHIRYGLSKDMDGIYAEYRIGNIQLKLLRGKSDNSSEPPHIDESLRSLGLVESGELSFQPLYWLTIGATYARYRPESLQPFETGSGFVNVSLTPFVQRFSQDLILDLYAEQAQKQSQIKRLFETSDSRAHALYASINLLYKKLGISIEHKDYRDFNFRMNDPVPLVREHAFYLLNRATHVLLPEDEKGHRVELNYAFPFGTGIIVNHSRAENKPKFFKKTITEEWFFEIDHEWHESVLLKLFIDQSKDEYFTASVADRKTGGGYISVPLAGLYSLQADIQAQKTRRTFEFVPGKDSYKDTYTSVTLARAPDFSIAVEIQRSGDPEVTNESDTDIFETDPQILGALTLNYHLNEFHEVFLFYGERRGGTACTAGTCYPVLPFKGMELRLVSRF